MQESDELLEAWHIGEDTYSLEPYDIGKGQFGLVKGAYWNGSAVALKLLFNSEQEENISLFRKELAMMQQLHHPHIVQFLGWTKNVDGMFGLVMEYLPNGSIEEYLSKHRVSRPTRLMWADQMAQAITYLHNRKPKCLIHRDVKPANFLLTPSLQCKLSDFGVSRIVDKRETIRRNKSSQENLVDIVNPDDVDIINKSARLDDEITSPAPVSMMSGAPGKIYNLEQTSNCGTVRYMAPEVYGDIDGSKAIYSVQADVFSLGMVYFFVFEGISPSVLGGYNPPNHFKALRKGTRPLFTSKTPQGMRRIIDACCDLEPSLRPTSRELLTLIRALRPRRQQINSDGRWRPDTVNTSSNWWSSMSCLPARMSPERKAAAKVVWDRLAEAEEKQASLIAQAASRTSDMKEK